MNDTTAHWRKPASTYRGVWQEPESVSPLRFLLMPGRVSIDVTQPDVVVGRHSLADVRLADPDISRRHCRLMLVEGLWRVQDLNSLNGVYLNGERIQEAVLYEGDRLRLGGCMLLVEQSAAPASEPRPKVEVLRSIVEAMGPDVPLRQAV